MVLRKITLLLLIPFFFFPAFIYAADNPFVNQPEKKKAVKKVKYPALIRKIFNAVSAAQHKLNRKLTELSRRVKAGDVKAIFSLLFFSFIFGLLHAIGPGHGKFISFSFFLSKKAKMLKGIFVGTAIAFIHTLSAVVMVLGIYFIVKQAYLSSFERFSRFIKIISFSMISIIGGYMLISAILSIRKKASNKSGTGDIQELSMKEMLSVIIPIGIIPCPGAAIILLFFLSLDLVWLGVVSAFFVALGMAVIISLVCLLTILAKKGALKAFGGHGKGMKTFESVTEIISSMLIILVGLFMLFMSV